MKHHQTAFNVFLLILIAYSALVAFWLWYPYKPNIVQPIEIMNKGKTVIAGDWLIYRITYDKRMNVSGTLTRKLVNSFKLDLADSSATAPIKKGQDLVYIEIPKRADPGKYKLHWSVAYDVNPIRTVVVSTESEYFYIIENPNEHRGKEGKQGKQGEQGERGKNFWGRK
jgi:hypothetical protein